MTGRGPQKLTKMQESALNDIAFAYTEYHNAQLVLKKQYAEKLRLELAAFEQRLNAAVVKGVEFDVPKSRIAREGLNTTSTNKIYEILEEYGSNVEAGVPQFVAPEPPKYSWSAVQVHPVSGMRFTFLQVLGDEHRAEDPLGVMNGNGYLFLENSTMRKWMPNPDDKPDDEALAWVNENPPA